MIYEEEQMCTVMLDGMPIARYQRDDIFARDMFIAQAQEAGFAQGTELASAFGMNPRTAYRIRDRYLAGGASGLVRKKRGPKGPRLGAVREAAIRRWSHEGRTADWMAQRLRVSRDTVRRALIRMGLPTRRATASQEPLLEEGQDQCADATDTAQDEGTQRRAMSGDAGSAAEAAGIGAGDGWIEGGDVAGAKADAGLCTGADMQATVDGDREEAGRSAVGEAAVLAQPTLDGDPGNRQVDRMLAAMGLLDDAAPVFTRGEGVPRAGALLALPALVESGVFEVAHEIYGTIGPAFYGLRTILLIMVILALLRIKHPENVKEYSPSDLGKIIGIDRAPEVKTIRRKLRRLTADADTAERFITALARRRATRSADALGFLYVDGHVRVYHGQADLPKTRVARMRLSLPATQDVWVNDANGDPVFVVTQEPNRQLVGALPQVLAEVRRLVGERRLTVVFDRGGWSPRLFKRMHRDHFDVLTYRKGKADAIPADQFTTHKVALPTGRVTYELHDTTIVVGSGFEMRQVTRRKGDHQTRIVTTRTDLKATEVATRMFDRWRQENFFKYMRQEFAIDALIEYGTEPDDPARLVPNPARKIVERDLADAEEELARLEIEYGKACADGQEREQVRIPGFTPLYGMYLLGPLEDARRHVEVLEAKRNQMPTRVPVGDIKDDVVRLPVGRKRLSDALKMLAYQVETDLTRAVAPHFRRSLQEGRTLIHAALQSAADIEPVDGELRVTLAPQSTRRRSVALARLCAELNDTETLFPGTSLRLRYAVRGVEQDT